jgi:hypothetical protein
MDPKRMSPTDASVLLENLRNRGLGLSMRLKIANELERARAAESTQTLRAEAAEAKLNEYIDKTKAAEAKVARLERALVALTVEVKRNAPPALAVTILTQAAAATEDGTK